jgi:hypothetical protein
MLGTFGMQPGGSQYRRLVAGFKQIFGATIFVGTDQQKKAAAVLHQSQFHFLREAEIWYSQNSESEGRESSQPWDNTVVLISPDELKAAILLFYSLLDEQQRRLFAGLESMKLGRGATRFWPVSSALNPRTAARGRQQLLDSGC